MRFDLDADQDAIARAVAAILLDRAGPARLRALGGDAPTYDHELDALLRSKGFLGFSLDGDGDGAGVGALEAAMVVDAVARAGGVVAVGSGALVAPGILGAEAPDGIVALAVEGSPAPARFAGDAPTLIAVGADQAVLVELGPGDTEPVASRFGYPVARILRWEGRRLGPGSAAAARAWWRVALALEACGAARAALDLTVEHVTSRHQFGRALGSFQAIQHRLAECEVLVQGARWLALEAAWSRADDQRSAAALTHALRAADRTFWETHQFSGALGFATEYDLHLWTMRLPTLRAEGLALGPPDGALAASRWGGAG